MDLGRTTTATASGHAIAAHGLEQWVTCGGARPWTLVSVREPHPGRHAARQAPAAAGAAQARRALQRFELHLLRHTDDDIDLAIEAYRGALDDPRRRATRRRARPASRATGVASVPDAAQRCRGKRSPMSSRSPAAPSAAARPCYVIAEAGANHNRDLGIARKLIDVAAEAGADAVKFQTYSGTHAVLDQDAALRLPRRRARRQARARAARGDRAAARVAADPRRALPRARRSSSCRRRSIADAVDELDALDVAAFKIASFELVDLAVHPLRRGTRPAADPVDGHGDLGEIEDAIGRRAARRARRGRAAAVRVAVPGAAATS